MKKSQEYQIEVTKLKGQIIDSISEKLNTMDESEVKFVNQVLLDETEDTVIGVTDDMELIIESDDNNYTLSINDEMNPDLLIHVLTELENI